MGAVEKEKEEEGEEQSGRRSGLNRWHVDVVEEGALPVCRKGEKGESTTSDRLTLLTSLTARVIMSNTHQPSSTVSIVCLLLF